MVRVEPIPGIDDYGLAAVAAVRLCHDEGVSPRGAWIRSALAFPDSKKDPDKTCPMSAFLGLCEDGRIAGIKGGVDADYIGEGDHFKRRNELQKKPVRESIQAARDAVNLLTKDSRLASEVVADPANAKKNLYRLLKISNNSQMDVVIALWIHRLFAT